MGASQQYRWRQVFRDSVAGQIITARAKRQSPQVPPKKRCCRCDCSELSVLTLLSSNIIRPLRSYLYLRFASQGDMSISELELIFKYYLVQFMFFCQLVVCVHTRHNWHRQLAYVHDGGGKINRLTKAKTSEGFCPTYSLVPQLSVSRFDLEPFQPSSAARTLYHVVRRGLLLGCRFRIA